MSQIDWSVATEHCSQNIPLASFHALCALKSAATPRRRVFN